MLNVLLLYGGTSFEADISVLSKNNIVKHLDKNKYNVIEVFIDSMGNWMLNNDKVFLNTNGLDGTAIDIVLPIIHGKNGEDGCIYALCELLGIPCVGCDTIASSLCYDKALTKSIVSNITKSANHLVFNESDLDIGEVIDSVEHNIGYPAFVKPSRGGSSFGVSKINNKMELLTAILLALTYDTKIIIEEQIVGRELECAILETATKPVVSFIGEIIPDGEFYDFDAKYNNDSKTRLATDLSPAIVDEIRNKSLKIFKALGCNGLARVDFFLTNDNEVFFNEINTMPGFTDISMYPTLINEMGITTSEILDTLITLGSVFN